MNGVHLSFMKYERERDYDAHLWIPHSFQIRIFKLILIKLLINVYLLHIINSVGTDNQFYYLVRR